MIDRAFVCGKLRPRFIPGSFFNNYLFRTHVAPLDFKRANGKSNSRQPEPKTPLPRFIRKANDEFGYPCKVAEITVSFQDD